VTLETMKLEELPGGRTRLTTQSVFQSVADRDGMLQSNMEEGLVEPLTVIFSNVRSGPPSFGGPLLTFEKICNVHAKDSNEQSSSVNFVSSLTCNIIHSNIAKCSL